MNKNLVSVLALAIFVVAQTLPAVAKNTHGSPGSDGAAGSAGPAGSTNWDAKLASLVEAIGKGASEREGGKNDPAADAAQTLRTYLRKACENPALLTAKLTRSNAAGLVTTNSQDDKIRIYCWDEQGGGTMRFLDALVQYRTGPDQARALVIYPDGKPKEHDGDIEPGYSFGKIWSVRTADGKTIYLPLGHATYSSIDSGVEVQAYKIEGDQLMKVPIFKTKTARVDEISCNLHGSSRDDINYDGRSGRLSIPLLKDDGISTGKYLVYVFDGHEFVYKDVERTAQKPAR